MPPPAATGEFVASSCADSLVTKGENTSQFSFVAIFVGGMNASKGSLSASSLFFFCVRVCVCVLMKYHSCITTNLFTKVW